MSNIASRKSVLAVMTEVTEGTPVPPGAATDFLALQDDFELSNEIESLENAEVKNSLGRAKPIPGSENPSGSFSHYLRHSGVEGQAPNFRKLLKAAFGGETVNGTQRITAASSTQTLIKAAAGTGTDFPRGCGLLIKDGINGYRIRAVHSRSTDDLTLGFKLPAAPAIGVSLGKCAYYTPENEGHPSLTVWNYKGNGGAVEMFAGCRVSEVGFEAAVGQLINMNFGLEGIKGYLNPIEITSASKYIDFEDDSGVSAAQVATGWYQHPHELAAAIETALNSAGTPETYTCTYSNATGKFTIVGSGTLLELLWNSGTNTANSIAAKIGFSTATDSTGTAATTGYSSTNAITLTAPYTPTYDSADPIAGKGLEVMLGDQADYSCFEASSVSFSMTLQRRIIESLCATSGRSGSLISGRECSVTVRALLSQYDADYFRRRLEGTDTRFQLSFGVKSGGNWVAGKCGYLYLPTAVISSASTPVDDGLFALELELQPYVDSSGNGEIYLGFL